MWQTKFAPPLQRTWGIRQPVSTAASFCPLLVFEWVLPSAMNKTDISVTHTVIAKQSASFLCFSPVALLKWVNMIFQQSCTSSWIKPNRRMYTMLVTLKAPHQVRSAHLCAQSFVFPSDQEASFPIASAIVLFCEEVPSELRAAKCDTSKASFGYH